MEAGSASMDEREALELLRRIILKLLSDIKPENFLKGKVKYTGRFLEIADERVDLDVFDKILIVGAGKASGKMAEFFDKLLGDRIEHGVVSVLKGTENNFSAQRITFIPASHPYPDENSVRAAEEILLIADSARDDDLVIALISGGGSALMAKPMRISLKDKVKTIRKLMLSGADIYELNTIRKHISEVKGGRLARRIYPATTLSLIISDVVGDRIDVIASGPTAPDPTTYKDAFQVLEKYGLENFPKSVVKLIENGIEGKIEETPKPGDKIFQKVRNIIVARNKDACEALKSSAESSGIEAEIITTFLTGDAREAGKFIASIAKEIASYGRPFKPPVLLIFGGETTVKVRGRGRGGRNQELALSAALNMEGVVGVVASVGTDGIDGNSPAAGGIVPVSFVQEKREEVLRHFTENDSYGFLSKYGLTIETGPTLTNVNDVVAVLVLESKTSEIPSQTLERTF